MHDRDRRAVAVSDQHRVVDSGRVEDGAGGLASFDVHVVDLARQHGGIRAAVAGARPGEHGEPRPPVEQRREVPPHRHAAEPLVQENEGRSRAFPRTPPLAFEPDATGRDCLQLETPGNQNA